MSEPSYFTPSPGAYSPEEYQQAKASLADPSLPEKSRSMRSARIAEFEQSQDFDTQAMSHGGYQRQIDPVKEELVKRVRQATKDDTLNTASNLKVFSAPPEYEPPVKANPFSPMSPFSAPKKTTWFEPSVKDFRAALAAGGPLADRAKAELGDGSFDEGGKPLSVSSGHVLTTGQALAGKRIDKSLPDFPDATLEGSEAFKAYRDAAWQHALADAVAKKTPIYRAAFTSKLSDTEKSIAGAQDTGGAVVGGMGQAATMGLLDPLKRSINPDLAASDRQQRNRSPKAEMFGELGGSVVGAPEAIARGTASFLGKKLGAGPIGRLAASTGAGAITGGADAQTRAIAQSAADALDAGASAEEMASQIYDSLSLGTTIGGAALGGGGAVAGHVIGSGAGGFGKKIVTSGEGDAGRAATIKQNLDTGGKMDWKGQIKTEPEIENLAHSAPYDMPADEVLARKTAKPMLKQRRLEQEAAHRDADEVTAQARERLGGQTVPVEDTAVRLEEYASSLADDTAASEVRKLARKLRKASLLSPEELDQHIELMDQKAGYDSGRKLDKKRQHFVEAGRILREDRDSLRFDEPTNAGGFALRDSRGNVSANTDYSAVKTELSGKQHALNEENRLLGLPEDLPTSPVKIGSAPDDASRAALAEGTEPNVQLPVDKEKEFLGSLQGAGKPGRSMETKAQERLAERSGVSKEYDLIKKMRARQDYRKLLAQAMNGISLGPGGAGNKFFSSNQLLRAVPGLRSLSGGLPKMEATQELVDILDRHIAQQAGSGRAAAGERIMSEMVPEARALNLRGGQPARLTGAATRNEKGDGAKLSPEEEALARAVIKNLLKDLQ